MMLMRPMAEGLVFEHLKVRDLENFDRFVKGIFYIFKEKLGFHYPLLFMGQSGQHKLSLQKVSINEKQKDCLQNVFEQIFSEIVVDLTMVDNLIVQSFQKKVIFQLESFGQAWLPMVSHAAADELDRFFTDQLCLLLPVQLVGQSIAVVLVGCQYDRFLTTTEQDYLIRFCKNSSAHLFTTWTLHQSLRQNKYLLQYNREAVDLIKIEKTFLENVQKLLITQMQEDQSIKPLKNELLESLFYLNSVLLLSETKLNKEDMV